MKPPLELSNVRADGKIDIAQRAEELGAELIVIGSHGLRDVARRVMGSVAEDTLHQAHCPVLVVR
jgi:nucleotide-binding universal stress UspA family protein